MDKSHQGTKNTGAEPLIKDLRCTFESSSTLMVLKHCSPPVTDSPRTPDVNLDVGPRSHISAGRLLAVIISFDGVTSGRRSRNVPTIILLLGCSSPRFYINNGLFRSQTLLLV